MWAWYDPSTIAAQTGKLDVLKFLAEGAKADLALRNIAEQTVYDTAIRHNELSASYLKSIGATQRGEVRMTRSPRHNI